MITRRAASLLLAGMLVTTPVLAACDKEDRADVREGVKDVEEGIDEQIDTDGKDD